jgi:predicted RNase H-like HicB family nuclease
MAKYLVVTHQTALSPELRRRVSALMAEDAGAEFAVLVPEAPTTSTWEGETLDGARQRAEAAKALLEDTVGARVVRADVGVTNPLQAIADELGKHPGYDTLVICTLPPGLSRWLRLDLVHQAKRKFGLPVVHVVAEAVATARR